MRNTVLLELMFIEQSNCNPIKEWVFLKQKKIKPILKTKHAAVLSPQ
jgi:hypothetical protein